MSKNNKNNVSNDKENNEIKESSKTHKLLFILLPILMCLTLGMFYFMYSNKSLPTQTGYVFTTSDKEIALFDVIDHSVFYVPNNEIKENVSFGDKLTFSYKNVENKKFSKVSNIIIDKKTDDYWPAFKNINSNYSYNAAVNSQSLVMDNEYIVSGDNYAKEFEKAIKDQEPYYLRIFNYGDGSGFSIIDVFYDGKEFNCAKNTSYSSSYDDKTTIFYNTYKYFEQFDSKGIVLSYLTNTKDAAKIAQDNGLFEIAYGGETIDDELIDMYWLYYDVTNYVASQNSTITENTLEFEKGEVPYPTLTIEHKHYYNKATYIENKASSNEQAVDKVTKKDDKNKEHEETTDDVEEEKTSSVIAQDNIVLDIDKTKVEPRGIHIEKDGLVYNQEGLPALNMDLSSEVILIDEDDKITLDIDKNYNFDGCVLNIYSFDDMENLEAQPIETKELTSNNETISVSKVGIYVYELIITKDNDKYTYVFFVDRQS